MVTCERGRQNCGIIGDIRRDAGRGASTMDQRSFQRLLRRTVALPVVLLVMLAVVLASEIVLLFATLRWVDHSDQVISTARQLQRQIVEMDTALRGYHLTDDPIFLDSYNDAKLRVPEQISLLEKLTADNPSQQKRLQELERLDSQWIRWSDEQMQLAHVTSPSTGDLLAGQQMMVQIREKQRAFVSDEEVLRRSRSARAKLLNAAVVGSAVGLSLLIAVLLFRFTRRELLALSARYERHLRAEAEQQEELNESREWFQITLKSLGDAVVSTDPAATYRSSILSRNSSPAGLTPRLAVGSFARWCSSGRAHAAGGGRSHRLRAARAKSGQLANGVVLTSRNGSDPSHRADRRAHTRLPRPGVGVAVVFRDVTQRRQTEQTLRSSERLTLAGRLSATIAHEIRNPLDTVTNLVYLLQHEQKPNPRRRRSTSSLAGEELTRIAQITSQLLTFHRESRSPVPVKPDRGVGKRAGTIRAADQAEP